MLLRVVHGGSTGTMIRSRYFDPEIAKNDPFLSQPRDSYPREYLQVTIDSQYEGKGEGA